MRDGDSCGRLSARIMGIAVFAACVCLPAHAQVPNPVSAVPSLLGLYIGAGAGQSHIRNSLEPLPSVSGFLENHTAWKAFIGIRPISIVGAEVEYADLGHPTVTAPSASGVTYTAGDSVRVASAFGLLYLPLPVPFLDVYGKAGYSRLRSGTDVTFNCGGASPCPAGLHDSSNVNRLGYGAGAQVSMRGVGVRADWERFELPHGSPDLWTLSLFFRL